MAHKATPSADFRHALQITGAEEDVPRMLVASGPACGGNVLYMVLPAQNEAILVHAVRVGKVEQAKVWRTDLGLAPSHHPELDIEIGAAVDELRALKGRVPSPGPALLRGKWKGELRCIGGQPSVLLARQVVSYGVLTLESTPDGRWKATFHRVAKWFAAEKQASTSRSGLAEAIQAGMALAIGLTGEACAVRDTHRPTTQAPARAAVSDAQRLEAARKKAAELEAKVANPPAPKPPRAPAKPKADRAEVWIGKRTPVPALKSVPVEAPCPTCKDGMDTAIKVAQADAKVLAKVPALDDVADAPEWLGRAARLIRRAGVLLDSPLCQGRERDEAVDALKEAIAAYNKARTAYSTERDSEIALRESVRRISERVALTAAKIGRACHAGQTKLPLVPATPAALPPGVSPGALVEVRPAPRATVSAPIATGFGLHGMPGVTVQPPKPIVQRDVSGKPLPRRKAPKADKEAIIGAAFASALKSAAAELRAAAAP